MGTENIYTYNLIVGGALKGYGYEILRNSKLIIRQDSTPHLEETIMTQQTAEQLAKLVIGKLENGLSPFITEQEGLELSSGIVADERILELVELWKLVK